MRVNMNFFCSQFFPERSAHRDVLDLFSAVRVWEGNIDDSEQKCAAVDRFSLPLSPSIESLIVRYWLKHFLPINSIAQSSADEEQNINNSHQYSHLCLGAASVVPRHITMWTPF